ncbi:hypothetical protein CEXT_19011 [Caerostris extrusa]|uniref:Uncharacterized protein n=1 Tax=Caerostris extrusa TaxID=172846 RepID=A0AAV4P974_CAEEX|nr:hypothetical protein CEXT_19011 [Caerostris extrusa]
MEMEHYLRDALTIPQGHANVIFVLRSTSFPLTQQVLKRTDHCLSDPPGCLKECDDEFITTQGVNLLQHQLRIIGPVGWLVGKRRSVGFWK